MSVAIKISNLSKTFSCCKALQDEGFKASTDAQLLPIRQLELFKERGKYENDSNMTEADKKAKLAEIDAKLAALAKQMK